MSVVTQTTTITDPCEHAHVDLPVNCYILYTTLPDSKYVNKDIQMCKNTFSPNDVWGNVCCSTEL